MFYTFTAIDFLQTWKVPPAVTSVSRFGQTSVRCPFIALQKTHCAVWSWSLRTLVAAFGLCFSSMSELPQFASLSAITGFLSVGDVERHSWRRRSRFRFSSPSVHFIWTTRGVGGYFLQKKKGVKLLKLLEENNYNSHRAVLIKSSNQRASGSLAAHLMSKPEYCGACWILVQFDLNTLYWGSWVL